MKYLKEDLKNIYHSERWLLVLMGINILLSLVLLIVSIVRFNPTGAVIKIGYGDIGGYRDGASTDMLMFTILSLTFLVFHTLIAMKIFHKRGASMAKLFLTVTTVLIVGTFIVFNRLLGES